MSSRKTAKRNLLLDEGLAPRARFPNLNAFHKLRHIVHDLKSGGVLDSKVMEIARNGNMHVIVYNDKDFRKLISPSDPSIICLTDKLSNEQIDIRISSALKKISTTQSKGHIIKISQKLTTFTAVTKKS